MPFTDAALRVEQRDEARWVLVGPLRYRGARETFDVPAGFETDFASVPRVFWWLVPRYGRYTKASVLHDHLCRRAAEGTFARSDADGIFRRSMREEQVPLLRRWLMWAAVRWGGGWVRDGLRQGALVLLVSLLALPVIAPPAVVVAASLLVSWFAESAVFVLRRVRPARGRAAEPPPTPWLRRRRVPVRGPASASPPA
jgi:hypothetical protein